MIINTGQRTDIPAFYSEWFARRLSQGFVCVRNPFNYHQVSRYRLEPKIVDVIGFCTKNPAPMFPYMDLLRDYGQYWFVTITPYGPEIEPGVPLWQSVARDFRRLSELVGVNAVGWRYDPIFLSEKYSVDYHLKMFGQMASALEGYTDTAVISFIDMYKKVRRNFPEAAAVPRAQQVLLGRAMIEIAAEHGMTVRPCAEGDFLSEYGADCSGCMTPDVYEKAIGKRLNFPRWTPNRPECGCYIACDIGAYDTCRHFCRYCYANTDKAAVLQNQKMHDPESPFLIGGYMEGDQIHDVKQESWIDPQVSWF